MSKAQQPAPETDEEDERNPALLHAVTEAEIDELATLRERTKPTEPPYLSCLWHFDFDHTCPWCLRHQLAELAAQLIWLVPIADHRNLAAAWALESEIVREGFRKRARRDFPQYFPNNPGAAA